MKKAFALLTIFVSISAFAAPEDKELIQMWNCNIKVKSDPQDWVFLNSNQDEDIAASKTIKACERKFSKDECENGLDCFMILKLAD